MNESIEAPIACRPIPEFDENQLDVVREAFRDAAAVELGQAWLADREAEFWPATVRFGWRDDALLLFAEMHDDDIFSRATELNQKTWELGDAFEIFLRPVQQSAYLEFHITPNNQRLQLRIPDTAAVRGAQASGDFRPFLLEGDVIVSHAWIHTSENRWFAFAKIPLRVVCDTPNPLPGQQWSFSFSRYDYSRGCDKAIHSSSSPHQVPDFHDQSDWRVMIFVG